MDTTVITNHKLNYCEDIVFGLIARVENLVSSNSDGAYPSHATFDLDKTQFVRLGVAAHDATI